MFLLNSEHSEKCNPLCCGKAWKSSVWNKNMMDFCFSVMNNQWYTVFIWGERKAWRSQNQEEERRLTESTLLQVQWDVSTDVAVHVVSWFRSRWVWSNLNETRRLPGNFTPLSASCCWRGLWKGRFFFPAGVTKVQISALRHQRPL